MSQFERQLTLPSVIAISTGTMLGSGIFILPGLAMLKTGPSLWLAYLAAGVFVLPAALSKAELSTAMPVSGGTYVYLDRSFGPLVGTICGLGFWLSLLLKSAFALVGFSAYLMVIADVPLRPTATVLLVGITLLNVRGITKVSKVQVVVVALALAGLTALSIAGIFQFDASRLDNPFEHGAWGFLSAIAFVFVSFAGVAAIAAVAEEVKDPDRNLPLGILLSLLIVTIVYGVVTLVLVGVVDDLAGSTKPVYALAAALTDWRIVLYGVAVLGVLTMTSMANAGLLAGSRFPFAMARDDLLPSPLRRLHPRYLTPTVCIGMSAVVMTFAIWLLDIEAIAKLASSFIIMLYMLENLTVIVLRETRVQWYQPGFRSPLYPWMQLLGIIGGIALLIALGIQTLIAASVVSALGCAVYFGYARPRITRLGVLSQRGRRRQLVSSSMVEMPVLTEPGDEMKDVGVVVVLFGNERSPEMLVDLARRLNEGDRMVVANITELPEQTALNAIDEENPRITSLRRRIATMAEELDLPVEFEAINSHDLVRTVHELTNTLHGRWLVMEWGGRSLHTFTVGDPLGWLKDHLSCNLADFHDAGVRYIKKILVHVEPGPHDALVIGTADHLAGIHAAELTFVRFVPNDADTGRLQSEGDYLDQVHSLTAAPSQTLIIRGRDEAKAIGEATVAFDLLVTAGMAPKSFLGKIRGSSSDRLTEQAMCSVLRVQAPPASTHEAFEKYKSKEERREDSLTNFIHDGCVEVRLDLAKKEGLFDHVARTFAGVLSIDHQVIVEALWERERTQNTALGHGLALPHATIAAAQTTHLGIFTLAKPIDCDAPDQQHVDVFFVTIGPPSERNTHLQLLGALSGLVVKTDILEGLRAAKNSEDALAAIKRAEASLKSNG